MGCAATTARSVTYLSIDLLEGQTAAALVETVERALDLAGSGEGRRTILLDEVTAAEGWQVAVKSLWDAGRIDRDVVVCTGSSASDLAAGAAERMPGRRCRTPQSPRSRHARLPRSHNPNHCARSRPERQCVESLNDEPEPRRNSRRRHHVEDRIPGVDLVRGRTRDQREAVRDYIYRPDLRSCRTERPSCIPRKNQTDPSDTAQSPTDSR
jgi:hypothetical protein